MDNYPAMHEKLDIQILILYILRRFPDAVDGQTLADLALGDGAVGYFEYAESLAELVEKDLVEQHGPRYQITPRGSDTCEILESSLPYTIRARLAKRVSPLAENMRRRAMITADHISGENGFQIHLALSDGVGTVMDGRFLCGSEEQAQRIEERFRTSAEQIYNTIMEVLLNDER